MYVFTRALKKIFFTKVTNENAKKVFIFNQGNK